MLNQNLVWVNKTSFTQPPLLMYLYRPGNFFQIHVHNLQKAWMHMYTQYCLLYLLVTVNLKKFITATVEDLQLSIPRQVILSGWPDYRKECLPFVLNFWNYRDELTFAHDLILKGNKIVIPKDLRSEMLARIHSSHMGIDKCWSRAGDVLFWPKMSVDITELVSSCPICLEFRNSNPKELLGPAWDS